MELHVNNETVVKNVQKDFNRFYPYLQLQFFTGFEPGNKTALKTKKASPDFYIRQINELVSPLTITFTSNTTVAQLLHELKENGLPAQISRKSGNLWIETSLTNDWTLERQNNEAVLLETINKKKL